MRETLVLLHGFGGTRHTWDLLAAHLQGERYLPLALDLPGHGDEAGGDDPVTFAGCVAHVLERSPERFALCGYSLGGRIALQVALAAPARVARLVLVSTTAGIDAAAEREQRRQADRRLAQELERGPYESFIEGWRSQPLFAGDPAEVTELAREDQRRNRPDALAAALRGIGTGEMESLWGRLGELTMPVLVVVGSRDERFRALGERMAGLIKDASLLVIPGGHRLQLENPAAVAMALEGVH